MIRLVYYIDAGERAPFVDWLESLDRQAVQRVTIALDRLEGGNTGQLKSLGGGIHELRLRYGPGYRIYLGQEGQTLVILLTGGTKRRQSQDIERARLLWAAYQAEKQQRKH